MDENLPNPQVVPPNLTQPVVPVAPPAPETPPVTPPPSPVVPPPSAVNVAPPPQNKNLILWISLALLTLAAILAAIYFIAKGSLFSGSKKVASPAVTASPTPTPKDETLGWKLYENATFGFSFKYPEEAALEEMTNGQINLTIVGPTQKTGTEFFDGLNVSFAAGSLAGKTLKNFYDAKVVESADMAEISATTSAVLAGVTGYKFHTTGLGEWDTYLLPLGEGSYLEIVDGTKDPTNKGFVNQVKEILATLDLTVASPSATPE